MDMMEAQIFKLIGLYVVYYLVIPGLTIYIILKIKEKRGFIRTFAKFNDEEIEKYSSILEKNRKKLQNLTILLVIFILISMPALHLASHNLQDISMHRRRNYLSGETIFPAHFDYVVDKIGPTIDGESVIEQMETGGYRNWHFDDIQSELDIEDITSPPSRITVYRFREISSYPQRIVITIDYLTPIPISRSIEFVVIQGRAFLEEDKFIAYPMPPTMAAPS